MLSCLYKSAILAEESVVSPVGGFMRVPYHGAVYSISPNSDMTAQLQQSSILEWAQSHSIRARRVGRQWMLPLSFTLSS